METDFDFNAGQCLVSDENNAFCILIRHNTLSGGDVKVCRTTVRQNIELLWKQTDLDFIVRQCLV